MLALAAFALCLARGEANRGFALGLRAVRTGSPPDDDAVETALRAHDAGARGGGDAAAAARGLLERLVDGLRGDARHPEALFLARLFALFVRHVAVV